jgi:predicted AlkP superfamily pyrophosphatase or phosphodiesterase
MPNIRLRDLARFAMQGERILDDPSSYPHPSVFTEFPQMRLIPIPSAPRGERDRQLYQAGRMAGKDAESLFLPLPDLDGLGHSWGIDGEPYKNHMERLDGWIADLAGRFLLRHRQGHVFVISDHGMVNVTEGLYLDIEERVGRPGDSSYVYFSDANLLRVWVVDESKRASIHTYLEGLGAGRLVTESERQEYGLASPHFGDFIYVLDEGLAFEPSTFARHKPVGMHGYHPLAPGQQAILVHYGPRWQGAEPRRMRGVYDMMRKALAGAW